MSGTDLNRTRSAGKSAFACSRAPGEEAPTLGLSPRGTEGHRIAALRSPGRGGRTPKWELSLLTREFPFRLVLQKKKRGDGGLHVYLRLVMAFKSLLSKIKPLHILAGHQGPSFFRRLISGVLGSAGFMRWR